MYVVAITGGIGAGKSAASSLMVDKGAQVLDLDRVSREVSLPGTPVLAQLVERFGEGILSQDGTLDRKALADIAFATPRDVTDLDAIVHPAIIEKMLDQIATARAATVPASPVLVIEVPLLHLYPNLRDEFDEIISVTALLCTREERAQRRGMTPWDFKARNEAQPGDSARAAFSETVLDNNGDTVALKSQIDEWWENRARGGWVSPRRPR